MSLHEQYTYPNPDGLHTSGTYSGVAPGVAPAQYPVYDPALAPQPTTTLQSWFNFHNSGYLKGFVVGAGVALVLGNPTIQRTLVAGAVKLWTGVQGGMEEIKEHVKDIKAEMSTKE